MSFIEKKKNRNSQNIIQLRRVQKNLKLMLLLSDIRELDELTQVRTATITTITDKNNNRKK